LTPKWNEKFIFHSNNGVPLVGNEILNLDVYDYDLVTRDDFLGGLSINVNTLEEQFNHPTWYDLKGKDGAKHGEILLRLRYGSPPDTQRMDDILLEGWLWMKMNVKWRRKYFLCLSQQHYSNSQNNETVLYYFDDVKAADKFWTAYKDGNSAHFKERIKRMTVNANSSIEYEEQKLTRTPTGATRMTRALNRAGQFSCPCKEHEFKLIINKPERGLLFKKEVIWFSAYSRWDKMAWIKLLSFNQGEEKNDDIERFSLLDMGALDEEENYFVEEVGLLKGRLWLKQRVRRHPFYVELEKGVLKWGANVHLSEKYGSLKLKDVVKIDKVEPNAIEIVTDMNAVKVRGTKLEALIDTDDLGDGGVYTFSHKKTEIRDKWYSHINTAFNQCQLDLQAWTLLKAGIIVSLQQKLEQGASAGDDNLSTSKTNGERMNMFQYAIQYMDPTYKKKKKNNFLSMDSYLELVRLLKNHNENAVTAKMPNGQFPIHSYLSRPNVSFEVFKLIMDLENKIKFSQKLNSKGQTPLMVACLWRNPEAVNYIINSNPHTLAFQHEKLGWTALHFAVAENKVLEKLEGFPFNENTAKIIQILLQANEELVSHQVLKPDNSKNVFTPVHEAVQHHSLDVVELLVDAKDQVLYVPDAKGNMPFHCACERVQREGKNLTIGTQKLAVFLGCRLYKKGKNSDLFHATNHDGKRPIDLISDQTVRADIEMQVLEMVCAESNSKSISSWLPLTPSMKPSKPPPISVAPLPTLMIPKPAGNNNFFSIFAGCCSGRPQNKQKLVENLFPNPPLPVPIESGSKFNDSTVPQEDANSNTITYSPNVKILEDNGCIGSLQRFNTADQIKINTLQFTKHAEHAKQIRDGVQKVNENAAIIGEMTKEHRELEEQVFEHIAVANKHVHSANANVIRTNDMQRNGIFGLGGNRTNGESNTNVLPSSGLMTSAATFLTNS